MITKIKSLKNHQDFIRYFKNTSWLIGEKILRIFVGLFVGIWVARYLGPEQFGMLSYAQSFVGLFASFSALGLDTIIVRDLVKDETKKDLLIGTSFWLKFFAAIIVIAILALAIQFTNNDKLTNTLIFIIASGMILQSFNVIDFYFQSKVLSRYVVYSSIISLLSSSILKIILILIEAPLISFALVILFDSCVLICGYLYFYYHKNLSFKSWKFDIITAKGLLIGGFPLMLSGVFVSIYMKIDQVMIKEMLDTVAVGQYAAATKLSESWYFIPMVVSSSLFPAIINAKKQNENLYIARMQKLYDVMVYMSISVALFVMFFGHWIVDILYGKQFNQAGSILIIHIWAGVFIGLLVVSGKWIINENLNRHALYRNILGAMINIVLNYFFIKSYGITGAAYATLISYFFAGLGYDIFNIKLRENFYLKMNSLTFKSTRKYIKNYIKE